MTEKAELRARLREIRASISEAEAACQARMAAEWVTEWPVYRRAERVLLYLPLPGELDTAALLDYTLAEGKQLLVPRCEAGGKMQAVPVEDWRSLIPGRLGLREPAKTLPAADPKGIDLALVPGVAFDLSGRRLGYGKGYFDRFLPRTGATVAGVAYVEQILASLPAEAHDVRVEYLVTARGVLPAHYKGGCVW